MMSYGISGKKQCLYLMVLSLQVCFVTIIKLYLFVISFLTPTLYIKMNEVLSGEQILILNGDWSGIEELSDNEPSDISSINSDGLEQIPELACETEVQHSCDTVDFEIDTVAAVSGLDEQNQISASGQ